jgi:Ca-activated chloride channel family protein
MIWQNPSAFWGLGVSFVLWILAVFLIRRQNRQFAEFATSGLWSRLIPELKPGASIQRLSRISLALIFACLALARPQWGSHEEKVTVTGLDIVFAFDVSNSMAVEDVVPNRLKKAQHFVRTVVERLSGDRLGLVAFAGSAQLVCPLTSDGDYFVEVLQGTNPGTIINQGTDIGLALEVASGALDRGGERHKDGSGSLVVILVSDGEDLEQKALDGAEKLKASGARLFVFGVGSEKGGPIPTRDETGELLTYKKDSKSQPIISRFDPSALKKIAAKADGKYWDITPQEHEADELVEEMKGMVREDRAEKTRVVREERFQIPLGLALLFAIWELIIGLRTRRKAGSAALAATLFLICLNQSAFADSPSVETYLENKKGLEAYQNGKMDEAQEHFGRAQAQDPNRPELLYNQGVIQLQQKDFAHATQAFEQAARQSDQTKKPELAGRSYYNQGTALEKAEDWKGAVESYLKAIDAAKAAKDPALEQDARKKIEKAQQEQEKKKQQKDQSKQDPKKDQKEDQKKDQDKKNGQGDSDQDKKNENDSGKDQKSDKKGSEQIEQPQHQQFRSQKLSKEDAERVMNELSDKEKELQGKLRRRKSNAHPKERDW